MLLGEKALVTSLYHSSASWGAGKVTRKNVDLTFYVAFSVDVQIKSDVILPLTFFKRA